MISFFKKYHLAGAFVLIDSGQVRAWMPKPLGEKSIDSKIFTEPENITSQVI